LDHISLVPCLAGLVLLFGGKGLWRWAGPAILFLAFMMPLPYRAAVALTEPLQRLATTCSTFALQTLGFPAVAEGNIILVNDVRLGVVEACSGLRMLVIFFALATGVALVIRRPLWQRITVVTSAVPIAIATNVLRITATGVLHETADPELANAVFHDLAGWLMMPVALVFLALELQVLKRLFVPVPAARLPEARATLTRLAVPAGRSTRKRARPATAPAAVETTVQNPA
jgi:exosortase